MNNSDLFFFGELNINVFVLGFAIFIVIANLFVAFFYGEKITELNKKIFYHYSLLHLTVFLLFLKADLGLTVGLLSLYALEDGFVLSVIRIVKRLYSKRNERILKSRLNERRVRMKPSVYSPAERIVSVLKAQTTNERERKQEVINLSHVKNMIKRLDCVSLDNVEAEQMENLKMNISEYDNGQKTSEVCSGINDGLNALLKIMAKYSV